MRKNGRPRIVLESPQILQLPPLDECTIRSDLCFHCPCSSVGCFHFCWFTSRCCNLIMTVDMGQACSSRCSEGLWYRVGMVFVNPASTVAPLYFTLWSDEWWHVGIWMILILSSPPTLDSHSSPLCDSVPLLIKAMLQLFVSSTVSRSVMSQ